MRCYAEFLVKSNKRGKQNYKDEVFSTATEWSIRSRAEFVLRVRGALCVCVQYIPLYN